MRIDEYSRLDATGLAGCIRGREVAAEEVYALARTAMLALDAELAFMAGELPEEARRNLDALPPDAPFLGVPTLVKDIGPKLAGAPQEMGSRLASGFVAGYDSEFIKRHRKAGLVFMGRSATPEMGSAFTTEPKVGRPTRNPWHTGHSTGGSSGGAASLVAAGVAPIALAGDSAGSIRVPAHCCGLFGLKPTRAATPSGPDSAEGASGSTVAHVLSRSVRDSAAALDATFGGDPGCRYVAPPPRAPFVQAAARDPGRLRIALSTASPFGGSVSREVIVAAVEAAAFCETLGHHVELADPPLDGDQLVDVFTTIWASNMSFGAHSLGAHLGREAGPDNLESSNWALVRHGATLSAERLLAALSAVNGISRAMGSFMEKFDVLLTPSFSQTAPPLGSIQTDRSDSTAETYTRESLNWSPFTSQFNLTGQPAMSVPFKIGAGGLPIGIHCSAAFGADELLFSLAGQFERSRPWDGWRPPIHASTLFGGTA